LCVSGTVVDARLLGVSRTVNLRGFVITASNNKGG